MPFTDSDTRIVKTVSVSTVALDPVLSKRLAAVVRKLQETEDERDQLILKAREQGASLREIAQQAGMSHVGIKKLIGRHLHPRILKAMDDELPDEPGGGDADE